MAINNILKSIVLDVYDHDIKTPKTIKAIAADNDVRYVAAEIQCEGVRYDVSASSTVELIILRPDKVGVSVVGQPQEFTYETDPVFDTDTGETTPGETITYYGVYAELDQAALAKSGTLLGQFKITNGEQVLHTEIFKVNNGRALDTETSEWAGEYEGYNLDELVERVEALEQGGGSSDIPYAIKQAILTLFKSATYTKTGLTDEIATIESWASAAAELVSISASYSGGTVRAGTGLDSLRSDLTVIATYRDSTTETVTGYTLNGTLTEGTQTVTVSYGGKTTTFTVTVVSSAILLNKR